MKEFNTIYMPILTFGCESGVLCEIVKSKIQAVETTCMRRRMGVSKRGRIQNADIRSELGI